MGIFSHDDDFPAPELPECVKKVSDCINWDEVRRLCREASWEASEWKDPQKELPFSGEYVVCMDYTGGAKAFRFKKCIKKRNLWVDHNKHLHYVLRWVIDPSKPKMSEEEKYFHRVTMNLVRNCIGHVPAKTGQPIRFRRFAPLPKVMERKEGDENGN